MSAKKDDDSTAFVFKGKDIPTNPGCYLFFDTKEQLLYVGKAKNLRKRVASYFQKTKKAPKTEKLVKLITKIETRIVGSEMEALILENNLIKEFQPRFNILMRDDKNFLYLRITNEDFPRLETTRRIIRDGSFYFGPKTSAKMFRNTIQFCQKVFGVRTCRVQMSDVRELGTSSHSDHHNLMASPDKAFLNSSTGSANDDHQALVEIGANPESRKIPCLDFHIKKCAAPCSGEVSFADYKTRVEQMKRFLKGKTKDVIATLSERMQEFALSKNFEAAAKIRDLIQSIEVSTEKQSVQFSDLIDRDVVHFVRDGSWAYFVRFAFREGKLLHQNQVRLTVRPHSTDEDLVEQFLVQFYEKVDEAPQEILLPLSLPTKDEVAEFFSSQYFSTKKVTLAFPQRGDKKAILETARKNAQHYCDKSKVEDMSQAENFSKALPLLAEKLDLKEPPKRMECYDISHFGGTGTVASMVVFEEGRPKKSEYRRFTIKSLKEGDIDDFASMNEILTRRFVRLENSKTSQSKKDDKFSAVPDLIVIDGGKGQLSAVMKLFESLSSPEGFDPKKQVVSLAKKEELIFRPEVSEPIELGLDSPALKLLQRIRDEAHRFAISFNRNVRKKNLTKSVLDEARGIGPSSKKKLLHAFGSVGGVRKATDAQLAQVLNPKQIESLRKVL